MPFLEKRKTKCAMIFKAPSVRPRIPPATTALQKGRPRFSCEVATLLRLPSIWQPSINIDRPRVMRPDSSLNSGQFLENQVLKKGSSETIRKMLIVLVMKWLTLSKKKKLEV